MARADRAAISTWKAVDECTVLCEGRVRGPATLRFLLGATIIQNLARRGDELWGRRTHRTSFDMQWKHSLSHCCYLAEMEKQVHGMQA